LAKLTANGKDKRIDGRHENPQRKAIKNKGFLFESHFQYDNAEQSRQKNSDN
jgi:hypothetical protein